jgi:hypothetical protein
MNTNPNDPNSFLNQYHVPEDADEYAEDLRKILERIPLRWGRWIRCDIGWYPLVIELDQKLAKIFPGYELHQVKEKFGTLRYYIGFPEISPQCCIDIESERPYEGAVDPRWLSRETRTLEEQFELDKWYYQTFLPHYDSEEHKVQDLALDPERTRRGDLYTKMEEVITEYEDISAKTCEYCGQPAELLSRGYWYKTLCPTCADKEGYIPIPNEKDDE